MRPLPQSKPSGLRPPLSAESMPYPCPEPPLEGAGGAGAADPYSHMACTCTQDNIYVLYSQLIYTTSAWVQMHSTNQTFFCRAGLATIFYHRDERQSNKVNRIMSLCDMLLLTIYEKCVSLGVNMGFQHHI